MLCMWNLVVLVLTWRSAVLALVIRLEDIKNMTNCGSEVNICDGRNTSYSTENEYVSEPVFHDESSSVIVKICSADVWRYKEIFHCECSSECNFLLTLNVNRKLL